MDVSEIIVASVAVIFVIMFIVWQFKLIVKYGFKFDNLKIDSVNNSFMVNKREFKFDEVEYVTVNILEQPSVIERLLSKSAVIAYMTEIVFHMKNRVIVTCKFNNKGLLYKSLCQLRPHVRIEETIEQFR